MSENRQTILPITPSMLPLMSYWRRTLVSTRSALVYTTRLHESTTGYSAVLHADEQGYLDSFDDAYAEFHEDADDHALNAAHARVLRGVAEGTIALPWDVRSAR